jgi:hypothetical protein
MIRSQSLVDYEKFFSAKVVIFVDSSNPGRTYELLAAHGGGIERLTGLFSASVLLAEQGRLQADFIVENEVADAWVLLVAAGRNRGLATKRDPQRINVDAPSDWEAYAFKEILRQVRETTRILEDVAAPYRRLIPPRREAAGMSLSAGSG